MRPSIRRVIGLAAAAALAGVRCGSEAPRQAPPRASVDISSFVAGNCGVAIAASDDPHEELVISDLAGTPVYREVFAALREVRGSGADFDADGIGYGILEGRRAGDGRLVTILFQCSAVRSAAVVSDNGFGFSVEDGPDGHPVLMTWQDGFLGRTDLEDIPHYDIEVPPVFFRPGTSELVDVSRLYRDDYERIASDARRSLGARDRELLSGPPRDDLRFDLGVARGKVLRAAVALIYAGHPEEAWSFVAETCGEPQRKALTTSIEVAIRTSTLGPRLAPAS